MTHEPGCPAIADDESDYEHLFDAGVCVCRVSKAGETMTDAPFTETHRRAIDDRDAHPWRYYKLDHDTMKRLLDEQANKLAAALAEIDRLQTTLTLERAEAAKDVDVLTEVIDRLTGERDNALHLARTWKRLTSLEDAIQQELETHRACQPLPGGHNSEQIIGFHRGLHWVQSLMRRDQTT